MKAVIQRVKESCVRVEGKIIGQIGSGMLIFLAVGKKDTKIDAASFAKRLVELRIFEDKEGKMNVSALDVRAEFLVISQFTLYGDCSQGRRPSFDEAADPALAEEVYNYFVEELRKFPVKVETGRFRAMMDVHLINDGPVTFVLESGAHEHKDTRAQVL